MEAAHITALKCNAQINETGSGSLKAEKTSRHAAVDRQQAPCRANPQDSWQALRQQISGGKERHASVASDVRRISSHPLVPGLVAIYGYVYDGKTGQLVEVAEATRVGQKQ